MELLLAGFGLCSDMERGDSPLFHAVVFAGDKDSEIETCSYYSRIQGWLHF
jgi:hypothetical protein